MDPSLPGYISDRIAPCPTCGCWLWTGTWETGNGYGKVSFRGRHRVVHRVVYELVTGDVLPDELVLDHRCRVRMCCNPDHLEPVTVKENTRRGRATLFKSPAEYLGVGQSGSPPDLDSGGRRFKSSHPDQLIKGV